MSTDQTAVEAARRGARHGLVKRPRLQQEKRVQLRSDLAKGYDGGDSIRNLAAEHKLSYGLTRTLLLEADVPLRPRGAGRATQKDEV